MQNPQEIKLIYQLYTNKNNTQPNIKSQMQNFKLVIKNFNNYKKYKYYK